MSKRSCNPAVTARSRALPDASRVKALADILGAMSDPTRVRLLLALADSELCVRELAAAVGVSESGVSHQLRLLRDRNLVTPHRQGRHIYYRIADEHVRSILTIALEHAEETLP